MAPLDAEQRVEVAAIIWRGTHEAFDASSCELAKEKVDIIKPKTTSPRRSGLSHARVAG